MREIIRASYIQSTPSGNIDRSVKVGIVAMPADLTLEQRLRLAVRLGDMPAFRTGTAGISWINGDARNTGTLGLVLDKSAQLTESPVVQFVPVRFSGLNPVSDSRQFFDGDRERQAFSFGNNLLGNGMVVNALKPGLPATQGFQSALGATAADGLQHGTVRLVFKPYGLNMGTAERFAHTIGSDIDNPKINAEYSLGCNGFGFVNLDYAGHIPFAFDKHQVGFTFAKRDKVALMLAADKRNGLTTGKRPDVDVIAPGEPEDTIIEWLGCPFTKLTHFLALILEFIRISYFGNAAYSRLSGKLELLSQSVIVGFMQRVLAEYARFKSQFGESVTRNITAFKRILQRSLLRCIRFKFEINYKFHMVKYRLFCYTFNTFFETVSKKRLLTSPCLKAGVSRRLWDESRIFRLHAITSNLQRRNNCGNFMIVDIIPRF